MKKIAAVFMVLLLLVSQAACAEEVTRVNFIDAAPFFFVLPDGFELQDEESVGAFVNRDTGELVAYILAMDEKSGPRLHEALREYPRIIPSLLDNMATEAIPEWHWGWKKEFSGGCWKLIGSATMDGIKYNCIFALGKTASIVIMVPPVGDDKGAELTEIVCHSLSYTEPEK